MNTGMLMMNKNNGLLMLLEKIQTQTVLSEVEKDVLNHELNFITKFLQFPLVCKKKLFA